MTTQDPTRAAARASTQREAVSLLHDIFDILDVRPMPDGTVLHTFRSDGAFHDRLCEWGAADEDLEPEEAENDGRHYPRLQPSDEAREIRATLSRELAKILARKGVSERLAQLNAA